MLYLALALVIAALAMTPSLFRPFRWPRLFRPFVWWRRRFWLRRRLWR